MIHTLLRYLSRDISGEGNKKPVKKLQKNSIITIFLIARSVIWLTVVQKGFILPDMTWQKCISYLQDELPSQQFNTWIRPLQVETEGGNLRLLAPNRFVRDWVSDKFLARIIELVNELVEPSQSMDVVLDIRPKAAAASVAPAVPVSQRVEEAPQRIAQAKVGGAAVDHFSQPQINDTQIYRASPY